MKVRYRYDFGLYVYSIFLFIVNGIRCFNNSFWSDECYTIMLSRMSISEMILETANDVHPPLYYLFTICLNRLLGDGGYVWHLSALIPYFFAVLIGCTIIRREYGIITATVFITLISLQGCSSGMNLEVRMYSLVRLLMLIAFLNLYHVINTNSKKAWLGFGIFSLLSAYTHYYALIAVVFLYFGLILISVYDKKYRAGIVAVSIMSVIGYLPWFGILVKSYARTADNWWLSEIMSVKDVLYFLFDRGIIIVMFLLMLFLCLIYRTGFVSLDVSEIKGVITKRINKTSIELSSPSLFRTDVIWVLIGLLSVGGTITVGLGLSYLVRPFFVVKYIFPCSGFLYLIFAYSITQTQKRRTWFMVIMALLLINGIPKCVCAYNNDKLYEEQTKIFLENVNVNSGYVYTNTRNIEKTILQYYYPQVEFENSFEAFKTSGLIDNTEWIIVKRELEQEVEEYVDYMGYEANLVYKGTLGDNTYFYAYYVSIIE